MLPLSSNKEATRCGVDSTSSTYLYFWADAFLANSFWVTRLLKSTSSLFKSFWQTFQLLESTTQSIGTLEARHARICLKLFFVDLLEHRMPLWNDGLVDCRRLITLLISSNIWRANPPRKLKIDALKLKRALRGMVEANTKEVCCLKLLWNTFNL